MVEFLFSGTARVIRALVGIVLILWAFHSFHHIGRDVLALVGLVFVLSGAINFCGLSPLFGGPFMKKSGS